MPIVALLVLFIAVPLAELYVILKLADDVLGLPLTIALLALDSILGSLLLRSQGRRAWHRCNAVLASGRVPHGEILDGVLVIVGGALLLTPGFLTDILGLALLIPATRALARRVVQAALRRRVVAGVTAAAGGLGGQGSGGPPGARAAGWPGARGGADTSGWPRGGGPPEGRPRPRRHADDVEGTATELDPDPSRLGP
jgi:UPF0716 protein FxsA